VGFVDQRLEPSNRATRFYFRWRPRIGASFWQSDGRPALCANGVDERDVRRERSARPGAQPCARAACRLRDRRGFVFARQSRLHRGLAIFGNRARAAKSGRSAAMYALFGRPGAMCMAAAIMISTFGCNNGLILASARVYYAMARDRLFFRRVGTTNAQHVPAAALVAQGIWTAFLTLPRAMTTQSATGRVTYGNVYTQLLEYIVSADLLFYFLLVAAVILLRKKSPTAERPYRTRGYPIVPIISILLAGLLIVDLACLGPTTSGIGILIVLTGVPVYFFWRKRGAS